MISGSRTTKSRGRPLTAKTIAIREAVVDMTTRYERMTVRGVFYQLESLGIVPKSLAGYRAVQNQVLKMRRLGLLDWGFIADGTRWQRMSPIYDSAEAALADTIRAYRHNLWRTQGVRVEVWLEKETLADIVFPITDKWRVPLLVSRGQTSDTYAYSQAQHIAEACRHGVLTNVFMLYDSDSYGRHAAKTVERKIGDYSGINVPCELIAVTDEQIAEWNLPTRPDKVEDREVVELDAIPPDRLVDVVEDAIVDLIDADAWNVEQAYEESERELLTHLMGAA